MTGTIDPDWELLARAGAGDGDAFAPLVERHQDRLIRLCERLLGEREEARDAAQEVFVKAYRHAARARPKGQLYTWLYRIAVNHCLNRMRRRKIARFFSLTPAAPAEEAAAQFDPAGEAPSAQRELEDRERWRATRRAIDALPESQRTVLLLAKFEGLSYREIADALGISLGAVESRLVRAMRRLAGAQDAGGSGVPERGDTR